MATHSSTLAWKIPWTEEPGGLQSMVLLESDTTERLPFHLSLSCIGEGNGNPLQCSCLENPRDGGAWWAAVYGVTQSWTRLKGLSSSSSTVNSQMVLTLHEFLLLGGLQRAGYSQFQTSSSKPLYRVLSRAMERKLDPLLYPCMPLGKSLDVFL